MTFEEAVSKVMAGRHRGVTCPCCGQLAKIYRRPLDSSMARGLIWLVLKSGPDLEWVDTIALGPKWLHKARALAKLEHWGLIEQSVNTDSKKRNSGIWRPTSAGVQFAYGLATVPKYIHLYDNHVIGYSGGTVITITEALGTRFDYSALMSGREVGSGSEDSRS